MGLALSYPRNFSSTSSSRLKQAIHLLPAENWPNIHRWDKFDIFFHRSQSRGSRVLKVSLVCHQLLNWKWGYERHTVLTAHVCTMPPQHGAARLLQLFRISCWYESILKALVFNGALRWSDKKHGRYSSMLHKPAVSFIMLAETKNRCKQYVGMFFPVDLMDRDEMGSCWSGVGRPPALKTVGFPRYRFYLDGPTVYSHGAKFECLFFCHLFIPSRTELSTADPTPLCLTAATDCGPFALSARRPPHCVLLVPAAAYRHLHSYLVS